MAKEKRGVPSSPSASIPHFKLGDRVRILHSSYPPARIEELRGPLGPGGAQVYRVRIRRKPRSIYIELLGDQLELIPPEA
jgi:hypothetical protein